MTKSLKLLKYRNLIGSDEGQALYDEYYKEMLNKIQEKIKNTVENMTGLTCTDVNIRVSGVEI